MNNETSWTINSFTVLLKITWMEAMVLSLNVEIFRQFHGVQCIKWSSFFNRSLVKF